MLPVCLHCCRIIYFQLVLHIDTETNRARIVEVHFVTDGHVTLCCLECARELGFVPNTAREHLCRHDRDTDVVVLVNVLPLLIGVGVGVSTPKGA